LSLQKLLRYSALSRIRICTKLKITTITPMSHMLHSI